MLKEFIGIPFKLLNSPPKCAIGKTGRCVKSNKSDGNCELSAKGRCVKKTGTPFSYVKGTKYYKTLDNGSRPFLVKVKGNHLTVKKIDDDYHFMTPPKNSDYNKAGIIFESDFQKIFIGSDENCEGNSILIKVGEKEYVHIGVCIFSFKTYGDIISYKSPVGNSAVPYPYARDSKYIYLMIEPTMDSSKMIKILNRNYSNSVIFEPYDIYYQNESIDEEISRNVIVKRIV